MNSKESSTYVHEEWFATVFSAWLRIPHRPNFVPLLRVWLGMGGGLFGGNSSDNSNFFARAASVQAFAELGARDDCSGVLNVAGDRNLDLMDRYRVRNIGQL